MGTDVVLGPSSLLSRRTANSRAHGMMLIKNWRVPVDHFVDAILV